MQIREYWSNIKIMDNKNSRLILVAIIFSLLSGVILSKTVAIAYSISQHPVISLLMRAIFAGFLVILFILKKKEYVIYLFLFSFPFMKIAFSGVNLLTIYSLILVTIYSKEIIYHIKKRMDIYKFSFFILLLCMLYTTTISRYPFSSLEKVIYFLSLGGIYFVLTVTMGSEHKIKRIYVMLFIMLLFCIFVSFWQYLFGIGSMQFFFGEYNPNVDMYSYLRRIPSIFWEAQSAGLYFSVMTLFTIGLMTTFLRKSWWIRVLVIGIGFVALCLTVSRMAILSFFCGIIFVQCFLLNPRKIIVILVLLISLVTFRTPIYNNVIPNATRERFSVFDRERSFNFRLKIWRASLPIIVNHPLGVGLGRDNLYYACSEQKIFFIPAYRERTMLRKSTHFENSYLDMLYSLGILGFVGFAMLLINYFVAGVKIFKKKHNSPEGNFCLYLMAGMIAWLICALTSPQIMQVQSMIIFVVLLALMNSFNNIYLQKN